MRIAVCIKQVPDSTQVKVDPATGTLIRAGVPSILNPYDHYALECALKLKKETGAEVCVVSMGPPQAQEVVRLALALGADRGILLSDRAFAGSDSWATSYALSQALRHLGGVDLIMCGVMAIDGDTAQTGPGIACQLGIPQITFCDEISVAGTTVRAKRLIEGGHETVEAGFPALATMSLPHEYERAYPSFRQIAAAQEKPYEVWTVATIHADPKFLGLNGSPTRVDRVYAPSARERGTIFTGSPAEIVARFLEILKQENFVK
jgi:electron transfer flavoprotein beta subunit